MQRPQSEWVAERQTNEGVDLSKLQTKGAQFIFSSTINSFIPSFLVWQKYCPDVNPALFAKGPRDDSWCVLPLVLLIPVYDNVTLSRMDTTVDGKPLGCNKDAPLCMAGINYNPLMGECMT